MGRGLRATAVASALLVLAGCGEPTAAEIGADADTVTAGVLTACVAPTPRLVERTDGGQWVGYDVEALEAVADALSLDLAVEEATFDELVAGVAVNDADRCDIGAGGVVDTDELATLVDVTTSYHEIDRLVVAPSDGAPSDSSSLVVGAEDGGPAADALPALDAAATELVPSRADMLRLLGGGEVDAVLVPAQEVAVVEGVVGSVTIVERVLTGDEAVMVLPRGTDEDLAGVVDDALTAFATGTDGETAATRWLDG